MTTMPEKSNRQILIIHTKLRILKSFQHYEKQGRGNNILNLLPVEGKLRKCCSDNIREMSELRGAIKDSSVLIERGLDVVYEDG